MSRLILVTLIALTAAGCTLGPRYKRPEVAVPAALPRCGSSTTGSRRRSPTSNGPTLFDDPALTTLVTTALKQNFDLRIAAERVQQARALYRITRSDRSRSRRLG